MEPKLKARYVSPEHTKMLDEIDAVMSKALDETSEKFFAVRAAVTSSSDHPWEDGSMRCFRCECAHFKRRSPTSSLCAVPGCNHAFGHHDVR